MTVPIIVDGAQSDLSVLLTYLRQALDLRDPQYSRLPAILDVLAIFHQLSDALIREAGRAIAEQHNLVKRLEEQGVYGRKTTKHGALCAEQGAKLVEIRERWKQGHGNGTDLMAVWSLTARRCVS
jgi:hypothetical protein